MGEPHNAFSTLLLGMRFRGADHVPARTPTSETDGPRHTATVQLDQVPTIKSARFLGPLVSVVFFPIARSRPSCMRLSSSLGAAVLVILLGACQSPESSPSGAAVIDSARVVHGSGILERAVVTFNFRGSSYRIRQDGGEFHYRRAYTDSAGRSVTEGITNSGVYRVVEGDTASLSPSEQDAVETTVNSVTYFTLLPEPLGDAAVQPNYSGRDTIDGVPYQRVRVTFRQEGGGKDWEDVFMYWFRTDTHTMDYVAYAYGQGPDEEAGTRFRSAYNVRRRGDVRVADYYNYTADTLAADQMAQYPKLLEKGALRRVSEIEIDSVQIRPL